MPSPPNAPLGESVEERCANCNEELGPGLFCDACDQFTPGQIGVKQASIGRRLGAYVLDAVLVFLTLVIGYVIWWLFTLQWGQTPGKQMLGIRAVKVNGEPLGWGMTFVREFVVKFVLFGILISSFTSSLGSLLDFLWALWDRDRQTLHDKVVQSVVIDDRELAPSRQPSS